MNFATLSDQISEQTSALLELAQQNNHRRCIVISGSWQWVERSLQPILDLFADEHVHWMNNNETLLGEETSTIIFNAFTGFNPDNFGAISGTLRGGGLFILLTPALSKWPAFNDPEYQRITVYPVPANQMTGRFLQRFVSILQAHNETIIFEEGKDIPILPTPEVTSSLNSVLFNQPPFATQDQQIAVTAIKKVVMGHRRRPLVISSDRGRGKSAALGIAAAQLMQDRAPQRNHILITAPRLDAVKIVFQHAAELLRDAKISRRKITTPDATLEFVPPDELLRQKHKPRLLLVDEAAVIPAPLLSQLLDRYARIVFATTIHGYEGTGRSFAIRFQQALNTKTPQWKTLLLETPVRWAENDPLEDLVFKSLLLNANPAELQTPVSIKKEDCIIERLDREQLLADESKLEQLFGLLINAHYQTRPSDLRYLLDGPNLSIFVLRHQFHILATVLLAKEGGFDDAMAHEILTGKRRPHGHLIPETLSSHLGLDQAPKLRAARIVRIAVHPALQRQAWGTEVLRQLQQHPALSDQDYIAASFGATSALLAFWKSSGYLPVRIGSKRNASSGEHSAVVLYPLSQTGEQLFKCARERFYTQLPHQLSDSLRDLETDLIVALMSQEKAVTADLNAIDWNDLMAFTRGQRCYEDCPAPIWKLTCVTMMSNRSISYLTTTEKTVLISKVLQKKDWQNIVKRSGLSGKKAIIKTLQQALTKLTKTCQ